MEAKKMAENKEGGCGNEFPYFGANYPDACCINGFLWDLDSFEDGELTQGGDDPCPFCNEEMWLENVVESTFETKEEALAWRDKVAEKWNCRYLSSSHRP